MLLDSTAHQVKQRVKQYQSLRTLSVNQDSSALRGPPVQFHALPARTKTRLNKQLARLGALDFSVKHSLGFILQMIILKSELF